MIHEPPLPRLIFLEAEGLGVNTSQNPTSASHIRQSDMTKIYFITYSRTRGEVFKLSSESTTSGLLLQLAEPTS